MKIKKIITDESILSIECVKCNVTKPDFFVALENLMGTANFLKDKCAGLAFNQINYLLRGFVIKQNGSFVPIINPEYVSKSTSMKSRNETCLSRPGRSPVKKRRSVKVKIAHYDLEEKKIKVSTFYALQARAIQHEMDHLNGILI